MILVGFRERWSLTVFREFEFFGGPLKSLVKRAGKR
jgi:hypothetical protein